MAKRTKQEDSSGSSPKPTKSISKKVKTTSSGFASLSLTDIKQLEETILESAKNYNEIVKLLSALQEYVEDSDRAVSTKRSGKASKDTDPKAISMALISSLFTIFGKLLKKNQLRSFPSMTPAQQQVTEWLGAKYKEYKHCLYQIIRTSTDDSLQSLVIEIIFRLVKIENTKYSVGEIYFPKLLLLNTFQAILFASEDSHVEVAIEEFLDNYLIVFDDIRYYFMNLVGDMLADLIVNKKLITYSGNNTLDTDNINDTEEKADTELQGDEAYSGLPSTKIDALAPLASVRLFEIMLKISSLFPETEDQVNSFYLEIPKKYINPTRLISSPLRLSSHKTVFQKIWLSAFKLPVSYSQYKSVLTVLHRSIIPNMIQPQMLLDFLTNAYDSGNTSISILALNSLFFLMQKYNLEYPNFFNKLYQMFSSSILHVKYRSRFLRLVDTFLSSTHIAANIVASFIKKLARLSLYAPPAAIAAVVPLVYNLLKRHPTCMVMIHRPDYNSFENGKKQGFKDPFKEDETDPLLTDAIESSLWELENLQSHYHPNIATLARILSEQFRKESYNMEDFLDMSYVTLMEAEQGRRLKAPPALEFETFDSVFAKPSVISEEADVEDVPTTSTLMPNWVF